MLMDEIALPYVARGIVGCKSRFVKKGVGRMSGRYTVRRYSHPRERIPWDRISREEILGDSDELVIMDQTGERIVTCPLELIGTRSDLEYSVGQLNDLRAKYGAWSHDQ